MIALLLTCFMVISVVFAVLAIQYRERYERQQAQISRRDSLIDSLLSTLNEHLSNKGAIRRFHIKSAHTFFTEQFQTLRKQG